MANSSIPDPNQMYTSEEDIAALFGVAEGDALVMSEGSIVLVITAEGQVVWISNGQAIDKEMLAKMIAFMMRHGALKGVIDKLKRSQVSRSDPPQSERQSFTNSVISSSNNNKNDRGGYSR